MIQVNDLVEWSFRIYGNEFATKRGRARIVEDGWVVIHNEQRLSGDSNFHTMRSDRLTVVERHLTLVEDRMAA